jgi:hypothetical protein
MVMTALPAYLGIKLASGGQIGPILKGFEQFKRCLGESNFLQTYARNLKISVQKIKDILLVKKETFQIRTISVREYNNLQQYKIYRWKPNEMKIFGWVDTRISTQDATIFLNHSVFFPNI